MKKNKRVRDEVISNREDISEVNSFVAVVFDFFEVCVEAFVLVIFVFSFLFRSVGVDGGSMNNTLYNKDRLIILNPLIRSPKNSDIVILNTFDSLNSMIVKRVIAVEGQTIDFKREKDSYYTYVDGVKLEEDYIKEPIDYKCLGFLKYPIKVPKGHVFVMGDNRNNSRDSRDLGVINLEKVKGVCCARVMPFSSFRFF